MKNYEVIKIGNFNHVVTNDTRDLFYNNTGDILPPPNYLNTGKALCGVLSKGESLKSWIKKHGE